jgi:hypothetical protein
MDFPVENIAAWKGTIPKEVIRAAADAQKTYQCLLHDQPLVRVQLNSSHLPVL